MDWYQISKQQVVNAGGGPELFARHSSMPTLLKALYRDHPWQASRFVDYNRVPMGYWNDERNRRAALEKIGHTLGVKEVSIPPEKALEGLEWEEGVVVEKVRLLISRHLSWRIGMESLEDTLSNSQAESVCSITMPHLKICWRNCILSFLGTYRSLQNQLVSRMDSGATHEGGKRLWNIWRVNWVLRR